MKKHRSLFFLDDDRVRTELFRGWLLRNPAGMFPYGLQLTVTETASGAIQGLSSRPRWGTVFIDHDLGGEVYVDPANKNTGMEVVRWLESTIPEARPDIREIVVHSWNIPAAETMASRLKALGYKVTLARFGSDEFWQRVRAALPESP